MAKQQRKPRAQKAAPPPPVAPLRFPPEPLLNLTTLVEHRLIRINETDYEILSPEEVSVFEKYRLVARGIRLEELMKSTQTELTDAETAEVKEILRFIVRSVLLAPDEVLQRLNDNHRLAIAQAFTRGPREAAPTEGEAKAGEPEIQTPAPTGER